MLLVSGLAIAPTLIASVEVTQNAVPLTRFTEALGWNSTGLAVGLAGGAAVAGRLIDTAGYPAGFAAVAAAGVLLVLAALTVQAAARRRTAARRPEQTRTGAQPRSARYDRSSAVASNTETPSP